MAQPRPHHTGDEVAALRVRVRGVVQGVGFRPFLYRLARELGLCGWVLNGEEGVEVHVEGEAGALASFLDRIRTDAPPAAQIAQIDHRTAPSEGADAFEIRPSRRHDHPTTRISPDLPVCQNCLAEMRAPRDRRYRYPYLNCTECGPRFSIIEGLPYDRSRTTMHRWPMCEQCENEYENPSDRRFHAQPTACPDCGPVYVLEDGSRLTSGDAAVGEAAELLSRGQIVGVKGIGGYHLACDANDAAAVRALRERKFRKDKPFALMGRDLDTLERLVAMDDDARSLLRSTARPIVLASAREGALPASLQALLAPENRDLGVMLPYAPLHHLLFDEDAPDVLVMTSGNRSSEPIAYRDDDARERLAGLADALLVGERPIARRVEDSVVRSGPVGPVVLRRARGLTPGVVAALPVERPLLALGADLKNSITLVVQGQAFTSQYIGDLEHAAARAAFEETVQDFVSMYEVPTDELLVVHDRHPGYYSATFAEQLPGEKQSVQHHRAHAASVLAERETLEVPVVGVVLDGTGYGDDGTIWGGEIFAGSAGDLVRVTHLRPALLPGGDAAARVPRESRGAAGRTAPATRTARRSRKSRPPRRWSG